MRAAWCYLRGEREWIRCYFRKKLINYRIGGYTNYIETDESSYSISK